MSAEKLSPQLRTSDYVIYVKLPSSSDYLIVHGYTGAVDLVDKRVVSFLRRREITGGDHSRNVPSPDSRTIDTLQRRGYVTMKSVQEERKYVSRLSKSFHEASRRRSAFSFFVAYDCNFNCGYCFQRNQLQANYQWPKRVISKVFVNNAYRAMLKINPIRSLHDSRIMLVGGEPLMAGNREIISYIVEQGLSECYTFGAITNGYSLNDFVGLLQPGKIEFLQVTLDGNQLRHDNLRPHLSGGGTFARIMNNIGLALASDVTVSVRINVSNEMGDDLRELNDEFSGLGWFDTGKFSAYIARTRCRVRRSNVNGGDTEEAAADQGHDLNREVVQQRRVCAREREADSLPFAGGGEAGAASARSSEERSLIHPSWGSIADGAVGQRAVDIQREDIWESSRYRNRIYAFDPELRKRISRMLKGGTGLPLRVNFCGAMNGMMVFEPFGRIYTCLETVGLSNFSVGTYGDMFSLDFKKTESMWWNSLYESRCLDCRYLFICGRGCPAGSIFRDDLDRSEVCREFPALLRRTLIEEYTKCSKQ